MSFTITFDESAANFTLYERKGSDLLPWQGPTYGRITKVTEGKSEKGNNTLNLDITCEEDDAAGKIVRKVVACSGMRSDNKPNFLAVLELLVSVYSETNTTEEAMRKARAFAGSEVDSQGIVADISGARVYFNTAARKYVRDDGSDGWSTDVKGFIPRDQFTASQKNASIGLHHSPNPPGATQGEGNGAASGQVFGGGQPKAATKGLM